MSLTPNTIEELHRLAKEMLGSEKDELLYQSFGVLVRADTQSHTEHEASILIGEIEHEGHKFIYFAN